MEYGSLGSYRLAMNTGTLAAVLAAGTASAGHVFALRWGDATRFAVVTHLRAVFQTLTVFTAATVTDFGFDAFMVRSYSASHAAGTAATLTGNNNKLRTSMGSSLVTDLRISTTAALTNGTETFDAQAFANSMGDPNIINAAAGTEYANQGPPPILEFVTDGYQHPIVLAQNEGIVIRNRTVWPAAGTGMLRVEIAWTEVASF
jgi:hypothetical protein